MHTRNISDNNEVRWVGAAVAAASNTDANSSRIDMIDYESVLFIASITDSVDTGVATLTVEGNGADSDTGMTAITSAVVAATSTANDDLNNTVLMVEVRNPGHRYVQAVRTSGTANIAFGDVIAILKPKRVPVTAHATVQAAAYVSG